MKETYEIRGTSLMKFVVTSMFGIITFLVPLQIGGYSNTLVGMLSDLIQDKAVVWFPLVITGLITVSALLSAIEYFFHGLDHFPRMKQVFQTKPLELVTKLGAMIIAIILLCGKGPGFILNERTGQMMLGLGATLVAIAVSLSYILPFLTSTGVMEFMGVIAKPVVKPLFCVPGSASLDLIISWFGASSAAVIMTKEKYRLGYYTKRETGIIMTNFSLVSIPFCMVIAGMLGLKPYFPVFYLTICCLGVILAIVMPRIYPLRSLPSEYFAGENTQINKDMPEDVGKFRWALYQSCKVAEEFNLKKVITMGNGVLSSIIFNLLPVVICWGTLSLILVEYTNLFQIISWPFGMLLKFMGVEEAMAVAPATLAGFVDMFIPALLAANVASLKTRFIIGVLSLIQIIYLTEVGAVILQSQIGINLKRLTIIFLERTLISLPIIVLTANIIF